MRQFCECCRFYDGDSSSGDCRFNPPAVFHTPREFKLYGDTNYDFYSAFPEVLAINWCGKFEERK